MVLSIVLSAASLSGFAQKTKGDGVLTLGASAGLMPRVSYNGQYDYALINRVSIGLGCNYTDFSSFYSGNISRTNIGARGLFHVLQKTNWDIYGGARLGVSIWSGSGTYTAAENIFSVKGGSVLPSVQGVIGARYLVLDWIGLNAELALGSPYLGSIGISANLGNTSKAVSTIKDAYNAELIPPDKKNIVKIKVGTILFGPGISYERYLKNRFSFEAGASLKYYDAPMSIGGSSYSEQVGGGGLSETDSLQKGISAFGLFKFYISAKRNQFPKGIYLGTIYNYSHQTTLVQVTDLNTVKNPILFNYEKTVEQHAGGLVVGYQRPFGKRITVDVFGGLQYGTATLKSFNYIDEQASEEKFISYFGNHLSPVQPDVKLFVLKASVGYMF